MSGTARAGFAFMITTVLSAGLVVLDLGESRSLLAEAEHYQRAGASTLLLTAPGRVDGASCEALNDVPGIQGAGALRAAAQPLVLTAMPAAPVSRFDVTPSFRITLGGDMKTMTPGGVLVSAEVADATGRSTGDELPLRSAAVIISDTFEFPSDGRRPGLGWSVLIPSTGDDLFDECWIRQWPENIGLRSLLMQVVTPGAATPDEQPSVTQLNATLGQEFTGTARFEQRVLRFAPIGSFVAATAVAAASVRMRRLELASNLHAGARHRGLVVQVALETAAWAAPAAFVVVTVSILTAAPVAPLDHLALIAQGTKSAAGLVVGAIFGAFLVAAGVRVRHFARLFKDRS